MILNNNKGTLIVVIIFIVLVGLTVGVIRDVNIKLNKIVDVIEINYKVYK